MDGLLIATAGWSSDVAVWSAETGLDEFVLHGHTDHIESVTFSPCGRWIATGSKDKTIRLWDAHSGTPGLVLTGHSEKVRSVAFSPNGLQVVSGSEDGTVQVWDVETGGEPRVLVDGKSQKISDVAFSPDGLQVASKRGKCDCVELWGEKCGSLQHTLQHDSWIKQFAFSSCGRWIVAACGREVWVWKSVPSEIPAAATTDEWSRMLAVRGFIKAVESIAWRPYSWEFVTGCEDGSVRVWKLCVETSDLSVQLVWSAGYTVLVASDAVIANTTGLSAINQQLLEQRGAIVGSSSLEKKSV
ncbi:hypothetical protein BGX23_000773 [Mortierella sp. AD031]|nr:hypothetical protein BGX23_000773 [Mortierella sp. AD031]